MISNSLKVMSSNKGVNEQYKLYKEFKCGKSPEQICRDEAKSFIEVLTYAQSLDFHEKPDYDKIRFMLKKIMLNIDQKPV